MNFRDCAWNFRSDYIHNSEDADQRKIILLDFFDISAFVVIWTILVGINVFKSKPDCSQCLFSIQRYLIFELIAFIIINWLLVSVLIQKVWATFKNNFRTTFCVQSLFVAIARIFNIFTDSWHPFTFWREREPNIISREVIISELLLITAKSFNEFVHSFISRARLFSRVARNVEFNVLRNLVLLALDELVPFQFTHFSLSRSIFILFFDCEIFTGPHSSHFHLVESQSSGLIRANIIGAAHYLTWS